MFRKTVIRKISAINLIVIMVAVSMFVAVDTSYVHAQTTVKIAHAAHGEKGTSGCKAGDQTGNEVCLRSWTYSSKSSSGFHWNAVLRCNDPAVAKRIARAAVKAANNDHIGYDKGSVKSRQSFYKALEAANWDPSAITKDVETSCSPFACACINAGYRYKYIKTDHSCTTLVKTLRVDPGFTCYTASEVCSSDKYLQPGDILVRTGHHCAVVVQQKGKYIAPPAGSEYSNNSGGAIITSTDPSVVTKPVTPVKESPFKVGTTYVLKENLRLRSGAGINHKLQTYSSLSPAMKKKAMKVSGRAIIKSGSKVKCLRTDGDWIMISGGWICGKEGKSVYIKKAPVKVKAKTTAESIKIEAGKDYKLAKNLYVRKGPGTNYAIKKRSALTENGKQNALPGSKAMLKKGTIVTCIEKKGNWMKVPSGWISCKAGNITYE